MIRFGFGKMFGISLLVVAGLVYLLMTGNRGENPGNPVAPETLTVYCAAGLQPPVSEILKAYETANHVTFQTRFDGSGALLSAIRVAGGDIFVAADEQYLRDGREKKLVAEVFPIASQSPVIVVPKGNPKKIANLADLTRGDITLSLADPKLAAIGRVIQGLMPKDQWDALWRKAVIHRETVNQVANDVKLTAADAGIVWNATAAQYPSLQMIHVPAFDKSKNQIAVGVLTSSTHTQQALDFARYLAAPDQGQQVFRKYGYEVVGKQAP